MRSKLLGLAGLILVHGSSFAISDEVSTPKRITTVDITEEVAGKLASNAHYKVIGFCVWLRKWHKPTVTPELEHFLPDLLVTVYKRPKTNPWLEAHTLYHNKVALKGYEKAYQLATKLTPSYGANTSTVRRTNTHIKRPLVDVYGNPMELIHFPLLMLQPNTWPSPYYSALADLPISRTLGLENLLLLTKIGDGTGLISGYPIGSATNRWGFELPRHFVINNPNNFKASVVAAMQAADLVTNYNFGHVVNSTSNSCGTNCVVANVIYDKEGKKIKWQEIYPANRMVKPGDEDDDLGIEDDKKGNGNYVFVVWRKYRGCVQDRGKLIYKTKNVGNSVKR